MNIKWRRNAAALCVPKAYLRKCIQYSNLLWKAAVTLLSMKLNAFYQFPPRVLFIASIYLKQELGIRLLWQEQYHAGRLRCWSMRSQA